MHSVFYLHFTVSQLFQDWACNIERAERKKLPLSGVQALQKEQGVVLAVFFLHLHYPAALYLPFLLACAKITNKDRHRLHCQAEVCFVVVLVLIIIHLSDEFQSRGGVALSLQVSYYSTLVEECAMVEGFCCIDLF